MSAQASSLALADALSLYQRAESGSPRSPEQPPNCSGVRTSSPSGSVGYRESLA